MKKYLSLFIVLILAFVVNLQIARAKDNATTNTEKAGVTNVVNTTNTVSPIKKDEVGQKERETAREEAKTKMDALKEEVKVEKDAVRAKIKEERITGREKALERFGKMEKNLNGLKDRINAQITKLDAKEIDTAKAKSLVATAETKLSDITTKITAANALLVVSTNELSKENKTALKNLTKEIQALINETHKTLNDAVKSLKDAVKAKMDARKEKATATTTNTANNTVNTVPNPETNNQ